MTPLAISIWALVLGAQDAVPSLRPQPKPYISAFCAPITLQEADPGRLRQHYADWGARPAPDDAATAFRPQDADAPGQMVSFADTDAPHAFVERRSGTCSLVYPEARTPTAVLDELKTAALPIGGANAKPARWHVVSTKRFGRPGPIRYFLPASEDGRFGLCATLFEDLRLHDATPATMVRVATCRIGPDDALD